MEVRNFTFERIFNIFLPDKPKEKKKKRRRKRERKEEEEEF